MVLRERNELKEQLDALRDELNLTRLQLRYQYQSEPEESREKRLRSSTKVRDIVTSITEPVQAKKGQKTRK